MSNQELLRGQITVDVTARREEPAMVACRGEQREEVIAPGSKERITPGTVVWTRTRPKLSCACAAVTLE